jgi:hypothetical protein
VGKTALANHLVKNCGFIRVGFADSLKNIARLFFPFTPRDMTDPTRKESPYGEYEWSPRDFHIRLGEFARFHDPDFWLKKGLAMLDRPDSWYVFDDLRFKNEASTIAAVGAKIVRIERYESENPYGKNLDIPSETDLDDYPDFDYKIESCRNTNLHTLHCHTEEIIKLWK